MTGVCDVGFSQTGIEEERKNVKKLVMGGMEEWGERG